MFVQCPFCQTKLSVVPESIPEMGKEKRCVNCMNRFRIVRTDEDLVVQYRAPEGKGARAGAGDRADRTPNSPLAGGGDDAVQEVRYSLHDAGQTASSNAGDGSGIFADFLNISESPPPDDSTTPSAPNEEVPIEQSLKIDQVFGELSGGALSPGESQQPTPRILSSKDLLDRQERGFRRDFRVQPTSGRRLPAGALVGALRDFFLNLTPLDAVLVAAFVIVGAGAVLGFTRAGFFGMNWIAGSSERPQQDKKPKEHGRFTKDEVYNLINLAPDKKDGAPVARFTKDGSVLPDGDYSNLFVEDVEIAIRSVPSGATVYRGEQALGATPLLVRMGRTEQMVALRLEKEGYEPETLRFVGAESRAFDLPLRVLGAPAWRPGLKAPGATKPAAPRDGKGKGPGDDFIIY